MSATLQEMRHTGALASEDHLGDNFVSLDDAPAPEVLWSLRAKGQHAKDRLLLSTSTCDMVSEWHGDSSIELGSELEVDGKDSALEVAQAHALDAAEAGAPSGTRPQTLAGASDEPEENEKVQWSRRREERRARVAGRRAERAHKFDSQSGHPCFSGKFCSSDCRSCK